MERLWLTAVGSVSYLLLLLCNFWLLFPLFFSGFTSFPWPYKLAPFSLLDFFCPVSFPPINKKYYIYLLVDYCISLQCTKHLALKQLSRLKNGKPFPCTFTYPHCLHFCPLFLSKWHFKNFLQFSSHFRSEGIVISLAATVALTNLNQIKIHCH